MSLLIIFTILSLIQPAFGVPPVISNLPDSINVIESQTASTTTILFTFDVTDADANPFMCTVQSTSPPVTAFLVSENNGTFNFYLNSNPGFSYTTTPVYTVTIACTDSNGEVGTGTLTVNLSPNPRPDITGLPTGISVDERTAIGTKVYTVAVTDADPFTCIIDAQSPTTNTFSISKPTNYEIHLDNVLDGAINPVHTVDIKCSDSWGSTIKRLTITVAQNTPPLFTGYPASVGVLESVTGGSAIHTIGVTDVDPFSCSIATTPASTAFVLDPATKAIQLVTGHNLTYATQSTYTITITCADATGISTAALTVNVQQNTRPVIAAFSSVSVSETQTAKLKLQNVTVTETDPYVCTIPTSTVFSIEPTERTPAYGVYLNANAGLNFATTPSYTIAVSCADAWGSDTKTMTVNVLQNAPPSMTGFPASVTIVESITGGSGIYTIGVTDTDTFTCTGGTGPFTVQKNGTDWVIYLSPTHSLDADATPSYTITVTCTDGFAKSSTGTVTINVQNNVPPNIQNLPFFGTVTNSETAQRLLQTLAIVESDTYSCSKTGAGPFSLVKVLTDWKIYLDANPNFSPPTPSYTLTITCSDKWGSTSGTATINMVANAFPVINGLPASVPINEADYGGNNIYTVTVSDAEGDPISCTIDNVIPASAATAFSMVKPAAVYQIQLVAGHTLRQETTPSVLITIKCSDGNAAFGNLTVTVNQNAPPNINSLPAAGMFIAGTMVKRKLHDLVVTDAENNPFTCTMSASPSGPFTFEYTGTTYQIYVQDNPTFSASTYRLDVTCKDNYGSSNNSFTLSVTPNTDPVITGMPVTVTVMETETAARPLHTIAVTDAENQAITCSLLAVPPGPFSINQNPATNLHTVELDANAIDKLDAIVHPDYTVTVTCQDSAGGTTSANLLVQVSANAAPTVNGLPGHVEVSENQVVELQIWSVGYTDAESDIVTCGITSFPSGGPFELRANTGGPPSTYKLWVTPNPNFNYTGIPTYKVTFTCTDYHSGRVGRSSNNTLIVDILENRPPVFTSANAVTKNAQSTPVGAIVHQCVTTDADLNIVSYSINIVPATESFAFNPVTCEIKAKKDLKFELNSFYTATITANDGKITTVQTVGITLININTAPILTSIGLNQVARVYFDETTPTNTLLYTPVVYDPDAGQTKTITYSVFPAGEETTFDVTPTAIRLQNGKLFDYEKINLYKLTMYVSDGYATTGPYYLEVHVKNVPEVCGFDKTVYQASTTEAGKGGGRMNIGFTISDADDPDYHTFQLVNNPFSRYFDIGQYSGEISFKTDYDIDRCGYNYPRNVTLIAQCTDKFGLTGTATVSIYVDDANDNEPTFPNGGQVMIVTQYTQPGALIGTLSATDCDYGLNADLEFSGVSTTGSPYYTVASNGDVFLTGNIDFDYGTDHTFLITAKDHGKPQLTGTTYLTIIYRWTSTTSSTTVVPYIPTSWWDKPENVALVACLALLSLFLLGLLAYLCCLRGLPCGAPCKGIKGLPSLKSCCKPRGSTRRVITPKNPNKEPFKFFDHNDLNIKRDMFSTKQQEGDVIIPMKL